VTGDIMADIDSALALPKTDRSSKLVAIGQALVNSDENGQVAPLAARLVPAIIDLLDDAVGTGRERLQLGEILGALGDPRISFPSDSSYWVEVPSDHDSIQIGRYPVTNQEFRAWADAGGYDDSAVWSEEGRTWLAGCSDPWSVRATADGSEPFVVSNQPVVGVTFWEADAYARSVGCRLPTEDERVWVIRGQERRPYPWGAPFGEGNANTREEVLGRPCAVGLYRGDRTPEGVCDLAGNAAEWTATRVRDERLIHPGAWDQPSMAAWAKAKALESPDSRWAGLGFRLARD
jgi:formylglycine-generating enzyme required for sulfatase activity